MFLRLHARHTERTNTHTCTVTQHPECSNAHTCEFNDGENKMAVHFTRFQAPHLGRQIINPTYISK